ncbi:hypothetical protein [Brevibacterium samyangense]|uniref:Uncharacterized protein n=1 Tax=Brevibacterium samyangense TaxID=366888 RepID=A0ABP5EVQ3_9MICO
MPISRLLDRGTETATFYAVEEQRDDRGNRVLVPVGPGVEHRVTVAEAPRAKAETHGQLTYELLRITLRASAATSSWDVLRLRGSWWELHEPPVNAVGLHHTGHQSLVIRKAPVAFVEGVE